MQRLTLPLAIFPKYVIDRTFFAGEGYCKNYHELDKQDSYEACMNSAIGNSKCSKDEFVVSFGKGNRKGRCMCNCPQCDPKKTTKTGPVIMPSCELIGFELGDNGFDAYAATKGIP